MCCLSVGIWSLDMGSQQSKYLIKDIKNIKCHKLKCIAENLLRSKKKQKKTENT